MRPYNKAAISYIASHRDDPYISAALEGLQSLMATAGETVIAVRLRGLSPDRRAKVALARLRDAKVKSDRLLAIGLAVHA